MDEKYSSEIGTILNNAITFGKNKGYYKKYCTSLGFVEIYLFDKNAIKNRQYDRIVEENSNRNNGMYIFKLVAQNGYKNTYYVGETGNLSNRTRQHEKDRLEVEEKAESMIYITSPCGTLLQDINNRRCLEHKLAILENAIGNYNISTTHSHKPTHERDVREFYNQMYYILANTIYLEQLPLITAEDMWKKTKTAYKVAKKGQVLRYFTSYDDEEIARIKYIDKNNIILMKGSFVSTNVSQKMDERHLLNIANKFCDIEKSVNLTTGEVKEDVLIDSPYALMCLLTGTSSNATNYCGWLNVDGEPVVFPSKTNEQKHKEAKINSMSLDEFLNNHKTRKMA